MPIVSDSISFRDREGLSAVSARNIFAHLIYSSSTVLLPFLNIITLQRTRTRLLVFGNGIAGYQVLVSSVAKVFEACSNWKYQDESD